VSGAGCPRVTHPFAALPSEGLPLLRFPLDLHVLGTPPAFVLSQDQTLRREPLDPTVKAGFGFVVGKSASPSSTPGSAFLWCSFVRPSSRQARRTAPPEINGVNALAFGTLFSSQGASADPKEGTPEDGVARPTMVGTRAGGVNRTVAPAQRFCGSRQGYQGGGARTVVRARWQDPVCREQARPLYVRNTPSGLPPVEHHLLLPRAAGRHRRRTLLGQYGRPVPRRPMEGSRCCGRGAPVIEHGTTTATAVTWGWRRTPSRGATPNASGRSSVRWRSGRT
jgi:hypothetical protein